MPDVADDASSATLTAWLVGESGDFVGAQSIATVETDTSLLSIEVAEPGFLIKSLVEPGDHVTPGSPLAVLGAPGEVVEDVEDLMVTLGLAVAHEAQEAGAHLRALPSDDPLYATTWPPHEPTEVAPESPVESPVESSVESRVESPATVDEPIVVRRVVGWADSVAEAILDVVGVTAAPVPVEAVEPATAPTEAAAPALSQVRLRDVVRADELLGIVAKVDTVSLISLVVKAVAVTSRRAPLHPGQTSIVDVAVQRWTGSKTVAPVVHVANLMTVSSLTSTLNDLEARSREGRLAAAELEPASITVVDLGTEGVAEGTIDASEVHPVVLTIGAVRVEPIVDGGIVLPARVIAITLSCDANLVESGAAARWLACLAGLLEQPLQFLT
jgi:pyruvate dehydrogenase E2 component (dihydrolipoamide acetyltransferase)